MGVDAKKMLRKNIVSAICAPGSPTQLYQNLGKHRRPLCSSVDIDNDIILVRVEDRSPPVPATAYTFSPLHRPKKVTQHAPTNTQPAYALPDTDTTPSHRIRALHPALLPTTSYHT